MSEILILAGIIAFAVVAIVPHTVNYLEKKKRLEIDEQREMAVQRNNRDATDYAQSLIHKQMDYDFARDTSAGRETTEWKEKEN